MGAAVLCAGTALAHGGGATGGLLSGLSHPVSGLDHVAAMVAVGLWGAQLGAPALWLLPVLFPLVMAFGAFLGLIGLPLRGVEIGIAGSAIVLGAMVLTERRVSLGAAITIVSVFALFHGHAHGTELPEGQSGLFYSVGFVVSTGLLHLSGIGIGTLHRWRRGGLVLRACGGIVLLLGLLFLGGAIS